MENSRPFTDALHRLRSAGLRPTRQRLALAKLLFDGENRHVTAESLHGEALKARVRVSLATVYNTLHQFTDAGLMREIVVDAGRSYFDTNISDHHHFYFEDTRRLEDIAEEEIQVARLPAPPAGAEVSRVDVIVRLQETKQ
ncbi:MAG: Fur family transcriptional regulator [Rhodospirillales bacterium]|nr:Fur family transcriptional regulator [Rhodospirillales bacterium]